jgi:RNA polymerase-binding transcription factor DksA
MVDTSDWRFSRGRRRSGPQSFLDQKAASSRAGQVFHEMATRQGRMTSPGYTASESEVDRQKELRRDWNRNLKNTPMGIMASGVNLDADPFGAQNLYHDMSAHLAHDAPAAYNQMYPFQPGRLISGLAENVGPFGWMNRMLPDMERRTPANVLAMRERFPGISNIDNIIPPVGIAPLIPEHIRRKTVFDLTNEDEGIFGGRGEFSPDFDYDELRRKRRLEYDLEDALEKIMAGEVESFDDMADTEELPEDKQVELETLLASEEFQALPQYEKERILLEDYGIEIKTGFE